MWQTKYALVVPKNLGVGLDVQSFSKCDFLSGRWYSVFGKVRVFLIESLYPYFVGIEIGICEQVYIARCVTFTFLSDSLLDVLGRDSKPFHDEIRLEVWILFKLDSSSMFQSKSIILLNIQRLFPSI